MKAKNRFPCQLVIVGKSQGNTCLFERLDVSKFEFQNKNPNPERTEFGKIVEIRFSVAQETKVKNTRATVYQNISKLQNQFSNDQSKLGIQM